MSKVNLVVQYGKEPDNVHSEFVGLMEHYDGNEATINGNGEVESVRFYWYDIPKNDASLRKIIRRLQSDGVKFKLLQPKYGNYSFE
jgi:hypothetical protein